MKLNPRSLITYARTRLWEQVQWPDPDVIYRRDGMFGLAQLLHSTCDGVLTKEVLVRWGADIHPDCWPIGPNITVHEYRDSFANLSVGAHVHIGREVFLDLTDKLIIEESVGIAMRAVLLTHINMGHDYPNKPLARLFPRRSKPTILRKGCSIGAGAIVACGVEVGENAVVNAGVFVDRDVPPRTVINSSRQKPDFRIPDRFFDKAASPPKK